MSTDKKRAQTSYGTVEYDTLQCAECTNETVTSEITHLINAPDAQGPNINASSIDVHPVCTGCVEETYGWDEDVDVLDHETLCQFYAKMESDGGEIPTSTYAPEMTTTSAPTIHGDVDVSVSSCSRCEGEWTVDDLRGVNIPVAIIDSRLQLVTQLYCPNCREIDVTAIETKGSTFQEVLDSEGDVLSNAEEGEDAEDSPLKQAIVLFAGGALVSIIGAAIHPVIGGLCILATCAMAGYALYRHFAGLGPIEE